MTTSAAPRPLTSGTEAAPADAVPDGDSDSGPPTPNAGNNWSVVSVVVVLLRPLYSAAASTACLMRVLAADPMSIAGDCRLWVSPVACGDLNDPWLTLSPVARPMV